MSLARIKATGRGRLSARLVIEGLQYEFVSSKRMERVNADGRVRVASLDIKSIRIGAYADLMRATLDAEPLTVRLLDLDRIMGKRHGRSTMSLWRSPQARCFLASNVTTSATSIVLRSADNLPASGIVHIGTEAIRYTSRTSTTLSCGTLSNRSIWGTVRQAHFVADGEGLSDALVTDMPIGVEGRRATLYLYGEGDDPQGDGTQRWLGVCASDVRWSNGVCEIAVDPITRILEQPIGGDLSSPVKFRGIHYTSASPWMLTINLYNGGSFPITVFAKVSGFFDTQGDFIAAANTAIASAISASPGMSSNVGNGYVKLVERIGGYSVTYRADSTTPRAAFADVSSQIDFYAYDNAPVMSRVSGWGINAEVASRGSAWTPISGSIYSYDVNAEVPRGTVGKRLAWGPAGAESGDTPDWQRIYLGGLVTPQSGDVAIFGDGEEASMCRFTAVDASTRSAVIRTPPSGFVVLGPSTELRIGRSLTGSFNSDLAGLLSSVVTSSPGLANTGAMPLLTGDSITWDSDVDNAIASSPLGRNRGFYAFEGEDTLLDYITPELLVCGLYLRLALDGRVELFRVRPPLSTDDSIISIGDSAGFEQTIEKSPRGVLSQVVYRYGYDPRSGEWDKRTLTFRDVQTTSAVRTPITLEVAQKSTADGSYFRADSAIDSFSRDDVARVAITRLGLFGMPTAVVTLTVDARYSDVLIGDVVAISSSMLPDIEDGCSPIVGRTGLVVATSFDLGTGAVQLAVLMHTQRFSGYAPSYTIDSETSLGSNVWELVIVPFPEDSSWLRVGDLLRLVRPDSATSEVLCTVQSIVAQDIVRVTTATAWTPSTFDWLLCVRKSSAYTGADRLSQFAFFGDSGRRLSYSGSVVDSKVFS